MIGTTIESFARAGGFNGLATVDYTEPDEKIGQTGIIGLQIHGGLPAEAWYKDIRIKELP